MKSKETVTLFLLTAARNLGEPPLARTYVVKAAYLFELLRPWYLLSAPAFKFVRYRYGPYSSEITDSLNSLVFHGLAEVDTFEVQSSRLRSITYSATEAGVRFTKTSVMHAPDNRCLYQLAEDLLWALQCLGIRETSRILEVVYNEPHFAAVLQEAESRQLGKEVAIPLQSALESQHPAFRMAAVINELASNRNAKEPREAIRIFLQALIPSRAGIHGS